jgi:hypothetical protein
LRIRHIFLCRLSIACSAGKSKNNRGSYLHFAQKVPLIILIASQVKESRTGAEGAQKTN